jgi:hypothetical protein
MIVFINIRARVRSVKRRVDSEIVRTGLERRHKALAGGQVAVYYGRGHLTQAIAQVGIDWVERAERQQEAMLEDLAWALKG